MATAKVKIGSQLIDAGLLTKEQVNTVIEYQNARGGTFGEIIVKLGFISEMDLTRFLASRYGLTIVDLKELVLPMDLVRKLPLSMVEKHQIVPIQMSGNTLTIATSDPTDYGTIEELQFATGLRIELNLAPRSDIANAIEEIKTRIQRRRTKRPTGALEALSDFGESALVDNLRNKSGGKLNPANFTRADLRDALIPLLIKKGVISRADLYDATLDLLVKKGVLDASDFSDILRDGSHGKA